MDIMSSKLRKLGRTVLSKFPVSISGTMAKINSKFHALSTAKALNQAGLAKLEHNDFDHVLHHLRGEELKKLPKSADIFVSVGCAGTWYFRWIEECCGPLGTHLGIEYYSPKPDDLPSKVEWIANTAGDMSSIKDQFADVLFSGQNIEHLWPEDVVAFLQESYRVLKPGGLLVIDSPNRLATSQLDWSHPEHTIELTPDEACKLIELSGFEVTALRGMWRCIDSETGKVFRLNDFKNKGLWSVKRRISEAYSHPNEAFCWWIEARKTSRLPQRALVQDAMRDIFARAWPERVSRFLTLVGEPFLFEGDSWFISAKTPGVLMYGPYMPLPAGSYTVTFELRYANGSSGSSSDVARVDVVAGNGIELAISSIDKSQINAVGSTFISLNFQLQAMTFGIQFRVIANGAEQILVRRRVELINHTNPEFNVRLALAHD